MKMSTFRTAKKQLKNMMYICAASIISISFCTHVSAEESLRVAGNFSQNKKHVDIEQTFFEKLSENSGVDVSVNYNPMDVIGVQGSDALRLLRSGSFDIMSVQIGMASRDDPFFEGIDLVGVATNMGELKVAVEAYRKVFDERLQKKFNAKVLTLWPFGPQMFYCNADVSTLEGLDGLKVRSFTPSMSALLKEFGATPVTLQFSEVYLALQRGLVSCGVTSPTSGNTGNWPEVTTHFLPLAVSGSVQGHFINLEKWNGFSAEEQGKLEAEFKKMEAALWDVAENVNGDAIACNTGQESCSKHKKFDMKLVQITDSDKAKIKTVSTEVVLPIWRDVCNNVDPQCTETWNSTLGKAMDISIK